jgi:FkbM family methyltransferase
MQPFVNITDITTMTAYEFETVCRTFTQYAYLQDNVALCRILSRYKIYVDSRDVSTAPHLIMDGFWETWLTQSIASVIKPGDVCIDIGANFGYYSVLMSALAGDRGRTVAVEPNPEVCRLLRTTAGMNHPGFGVAECALSDKTGRINLVIPGNYSGDASIIDRPARPSSRNVKVKVETITLDSLLERMEITKVDMIKMDVEGAEPLVFEGMKATIDANPSLTIIMEYSPHLYSDARTFTTYLFSIFNVHRAGGEREPIPESSMNELLELKDHTDLLLTRK